MPQEVSEARIRTFFQEMSEEGEAVDGLMRSFLRLRTILKSGESVQALPTAEKQRTKIFLRGLGYTLAVIRDLKEKTIRVNIVLLLLSTGNLLATLGYYKVASGTPPEEWIQEKQKNEHALSAAFAE